MKQCKECNEIKNESDFYKGHGKCKICRIKYQKSILDPIKRSEYVKQYYAKNKEEQIDKSKEYYKNNSELIKEKRRIYYSKNRDKKLTYQNEYQRNNKEKRNAYLVNRKKNDPIFKLKYAVYRIIGNSIKYKKKNIRATEILGCSIQEFKIHLESKFESWMSWENYGLYNGDFKFGWDIDHIIPVSLAETEDDVLRLSHYSNLQPLCSKINRDVKKHNVQLY